MTETMFVTQIGDPTFFHTGTKEEMCGLKRRLNGAYNTVDIYPIADTGVYLLVAQNRYDAETFTGKMR